MRSAGNGFIGRQIGHADTLFVPDEGFLMRSVGMGVFIVGVLFGWWGGNVTCKGFETVDMDGRMDNGSEDLEQRRQMKSMFLGLNFRW